MFLFGETVTSWLIPRGVDVELTSRGPGGCEASFQQLQQIASECKIYTPVM